MRPARGIAIAALLLTVATPPAAAATTHVHIENFLFSPLTVTIAVGDTVTWHNHDATPHTATRTTTPGAFDTGAIDPGESRSITFTTEGTYDYFCKFHPNMRGTVRVEPAAPPPNRAPHASIGSSTEDLVLTVDGTGSSDPDGDPLTYAWSWGDGTPEGTDAVASHTYAQAGTYTLRLTVSDGELSDSHEREVTVSMPNRAPTADFTTQMTDLLVVADGSGSTDPDGDALTFTWTWGDASAASTGVNASHTYAAEGDFTIELLVSDGELAATAQRVVRPAAANRAPDASFVATMEGLDLAVDASASSDLDGDALSFAWDWGDASAGGSGMRANHSFAAPGNYTIRLNVSDGLGLFAETTREVQAEPENRAPLADFSFLVDGLVLAVDASGSSDPDGDPLTFEWDWGDESARSSGRDATHTYAAAGNFSVRLTVGDAIAASVKDRVVSVFAKPQENASVPIAPQPPANAAPRLTLTSGVKEATLAFGASLAWSGTAADPDGDDVVVRARIVGGEPLLVSGAWRIAWTPSSLGEHVIEVVASDGAHDSDPLRLLVLVRENEPPSALPLLPEILPPVNGSTTLEGMWSDPEKTLVRVEVSFANGTWRPAQVSADGMWRLDWNASEYPPGPLAFSVRASDEKATTVQGPYQVRVEGEPPPQVSPERLEERAIEATAIEAQTPPAPTPGPAPWLVVLALALCARRRASERARG